MIENLMKVESILENKETVLSYMPCCIRSFEYSEIYKLGIIVATNKKLIFYGENIYEAEFIKNFDYKHISFIEQDKAALKNSIIIYCNHESIRLSNIVSENIGEFINVVKDKINV